MKNENLLSRLSEFISEPSLSSPNRREYDEVMAELESLVSASEYRSDDWVPFKGPSIPVDGPLDDDGPSTIYGE